MLKLQSIDVQKFAAPLLAVPVCEDAEIHEGATATLVAEAKKIKEFGGRKDEELILYRPPGTRVERVLFLGIGKRDRTDGETLRAFAGKAVKACIKKDLSGLVLAAPADDSLPLKAADAIHAMLEGACLANHVFDKYKKEKKSKPLKSITVSAAPQAVKANAAAARRITAVCGGTILAREWVTTPSNDKKPDRFSRLVMAEAKKANLKTAVWGEKELKQGKFGAILAVGAGSQNKPRLLFLEHYPRGAKKTIVLVGKGVTFDSGGLNLKPGGSMEDMKTDMSGAAAVAATLITAARLKLKARVVGVLPIVENMPSGAATRPGDIVKSYHGKTIEINNTDAEGRLILVDAMSYAIQKYSPDVLIDIATLTGACVVALGEKIAGLFTADDELADAVLEAGRKTHERIWRMPLPEDYRELLKSDTADIANVSNSRWGGAITAALFLSEFVGDARWAHIDIAGPASIKKGHEYCDAGGTGFGVRLFCELIERLA